MNDFRCINCELETGMKAVENTFMLLYVFQVIRYYLWYIHKQCFFTIASLFVFVRIGPREAAILISYKGSWIQIFLLNINAGKGLESISSTIVLIMVHWLDMFLIMNISENYVKCFIQWYICEKENNLGRFSYLSQIIHEEQVLFIFSAG